MYDSNKHIKVFHDKHVSLSETQRSQMRNRRNSCETRVKNGLSKNEQPSPLEFVAQGSYAMHTMVQSDSNDYDIDDGIVFDKSDLVNSQGGDISALNVRKMICDAVSDDTFKKPPTVLKNCVRIYYNDGSHIDMPAYRKLEGGTLELASSDWKGSSPSEVTAWFNSAVIDKSPDSTNGRQMRRITKLLKAFTKSRNSWVNQMISGFALSVLVSESYSSNSLSDAESLYYTMININSRLNTSKVIFHPTRTGETLTKTSNDPDVVFFNKQLKKAIDNLSILLDPDCDDKDSLKAWKKVFNHAYFEEEIEKINDEEKSRIAESLSKGNQGLTLEKGLASIGAVGTSSASTSIKTGNAYGHKLDNENNEQL